MLTAVVAAGTLAAAVATATPAAAIGNGFDPHTAPVVIPGTSTVVNEWRLAGQGFARGVQIAPQWILSAGHAPLGPGNVFTNEYGSATVDRLAGNCAGQNSGCDISVSHLATPINAPSYPRLLLDGVQDAPGGTATGNTLAVGNGGSTNGRPTVGWTQPTRKGTSLATLQNGPSAINGDSGGPAFYFYPGATTGVLQGLNANAATGVTEGVQQLSSARVKPFLDGILPAGTVTWVTFDQLGPPRYAPEGVGNPTVSADATSITLTWPAVTATPAVTGYRAALIRTDDVRSAMTITTDANTHTATFRGTPVGVTYGAVVLPSNANGESGVPYVTLSGNAFDYAPPSVTYQTIIAASGPPEMPARAFATTGGNDRLNIKVRTSPNFVPGVTQLEAFAYRCDPAPCGVSNLTLIAHITSLSTTFQVGLPADTPPAAVFEVRVRERNSLGAGGFTVTTAAYAPLAPALPPTSITVAPQADGTASVSFTAPPTEPTTAPVVLAGYRPHAAADLYEVRVTAPGGSPVDVDGLQVGETSRFNLADDGLPPGTYSVDVIASSLAWGRSAPVATVPISLGTVTGTPPAPVGAVSTPVAPPRPTNLVVPPGTAGTMTWTEPASGPGVAAPDEFLVVISDHANPQVAPVVAELPTLQHSYVYRVPFTDPFDVNVYALSQAIGPSAPATVTVTGG